MRRNFTPGDTMTRAEFYMELRTAWDEDLEFLSRFQKLPEARLLSEQIQIAIRRLDGVYGVHHLFDLETLGRKSARIRPGKH